MITLTFTCAVCGEEFLHQRKSRNGAPRKYCPACTRQRSVDGQRSYKARRKEIEARPEIVDLRAAQRKELEDNLGAKVTKYRLAIQLARGYVVAGHYAQALEVLDV